MQRKTNASPLRNALHFPRSLQSLSSMQALPVGCAVGVVVGPGVGDFTGALVGFGVGAVDGAAVSWSIAASSCTLTDDAVLSGKSSKLR